MSSGQGKFPFEVVTDNNLLRQRYEDAELEGKLPLYVTTTSAQGIEEVMGIMPPSALDYIAAQIGGGGGASGSQEFAGFTPSVLASFVSGTTASQSGTTVTVTSTAHGIVGSTAKNGYRIYFPGSASIPAGWYQGFAWVDANTVTFQLAPATVVSESVNSGSAFTAEVTLTTKTIAANALGDSGQLTIDTVRSGTTTIGNKTVVAKLNGNTLASLALSSQPNGRFAQTISNIASTSRQMGFSAQDGTSSNAATLSGSVDTTTNATLTVTMQLFAAQLWMAVDNISLRIVKRAAVS